MTDPDTELDRLLEATNPVDENRLPLPAESDAAQILYEKITGTPYAGDSGSPVRRALPRRWLGAGIAALVAVLGVTGVAAYAGLNNHTSQRLVVTCYAGPSLATRRCT